MAGNPLTVEDLWKIPRVGAPVPAPDGSFVIVPVTTWSMETNEKTTRLWLVPADGGAARALTSAETSSEQPAVSPDGKSIAFIRKPALRKPAESKTKSPSAGRAGSVGALASDGPDGDDAAATHGAGRASGHAAGPSYPEQPQLYVMSLEGGEPERLTDLPLGVLDPRWFPDGGRIAFLSSVYVQARTIDGTAQEVKRREEDPVKAAVTEDRVYRYWDHWLTDGKVHHIFAIDIGTKGVTDLTPSLSGWFPMDEPSDNYRIAPDGREIAFTAVRSTPPHDPLVYGAFTVRVPDPSDAAGEAPKPVLIDPDQEAHVFGAVYSPDGRWIVYGFQREIDFYADRHRLIALDRASGKRTVMTETWDRSAMGWSFLNDSRTLVLWAEEEARTSLFAIDVGRAVTEPGDRHIRRIARGGTFTDPRPAGRRIFTSLQSLNAPPEICALDPDGSDLRRITTFTQESMSKVDLGEVEEVHFEGADCRSVQMFLVHPPRSAPGREGAPEGGAARGGAAAKSGKGPGSRGARPLVQVVHGGPHAASADTWHWRWNAHAFAAPGYLVAMVNFHGSTGWGQEFAASILGRWGDQPLRDVLAATDLLVERGLADPARMAIAGGSYGGYLVSWIGTQTERFACIVNHAGVCDFQTQFASDITQGRRRAMGGSPWDGIEAMDRYNPMRHASGFKSPMLVLHGEKDYRVPYNQALEIYNVHKAMKVPARLVCYPDENHWILKPRNSKHWFGEVLGWLEKWIGTGREPAERRANP